MTHAMKSHVKKNRLKLKNAKFIIYKMSSETDWNVHCIYIDLVNEILNAPETQSVS